MFPNVVPPPGPLLTVAGVLLWGFFCVLLLCRGLFCCWSYFSSLSLVSDVSSLAVSFDVSSPLSAFSFFVSDSVFLASSSGVVFVLGLLLVISLVVYSVCSVISKLLGLFFTGSGPYPWVVCGLLLWALGPLASPGGGCANVYLFALSSFVFYLVFYRSSSVGLASSLFAFSCAVSSNSSFSVVVSLISVLFSVMFVFVLPLSVIFSEFSVLFVGTSLLSSGVN